MHPTSSKLCHGIKVENGYRRTSRAAPADDVRPKSAARSIEANRRMLDVSWNRIRPCAREEPGKTFRASCPPAARDLHRRVRSAAPGFLQVQLAALDRRWDT